MDTIYRFSILSCLVFPIIIAFLNYKKYKNLYFSGALLLLLAPVSGFILTIFLLFYVGYVGIYIGPFVGYSLAVISMIIILVAIVRSILKYVKSNK